MVCVGLFMISRNLVTRTTATRRGARMHPEEQITQLLYLIVTRMRVRNCCSRWSMWPRGVRGRRPGPGRLGRRWAVRGRPDRGAGRSWRGRAVRGDAFLPHVPPVPALCATIVHVSPCDPVVSAALGEQGMGGLVDFCAAEERTGALRARVHKVRAVGGDEAGPVLRVCL